MSWVMHRMAHILEWLGLGFHIPLPRTELPQESKSALLPTASRLIEKAVALAPDDMLYRMWELYVVSQGIKTEAGYKSWNQVKPDDEDRIAELLWPYFEAYLSTRRGFLLGEPPELSSATTAEYLSSNSAANYVSLALFPYIAAKESAILLAACAARHQDRERLLLVLKGVRHLADLEPTQPMTVFLEQVTLNNLLKEVSENSPSEQLASAFKRIRDDFAEFIKATSDERLKEIDQINELAAEGRYRAAARLKVSEALEVQKEIDEAIASARRALSEIPE